MARLSRALVLNVILCLGGCTASRGEDGYLILESRTGAIEFVDPITLKTHSSIRVETAPEGVGLNGIAVDADGRKLYVEGPIGGSSAAANSCCNLYSIDLATLQARLVADVWGTRSRGNFISAGAGLMQPISAAAASTTGKVEGTHWQASPDGRWWFGLRNGPAVDIYDPAQGAIVRSLTASGFDDTRPASGVWLKDKFYIHESHDGSDRLWTVSPKSTQLGEGVAIPVLGQVPGCSAGLVDLIAAGDRLVVYEVFGGKIDPRDQCSDVAGGAWLIDAATERPVGHIAPALTFWMLIANRDGSELYGVTSEFPNQQQGARLVRLDVGSGKVLEARPLANDHYWNLAMAPLQLVPPGNGTVVLPSEGVR